MTQIDEVFKEFDKTINSGNLRPISNKEMQQANFVYRQRIIIAQIRYYIRKFWHFFIG